MPIRTRRSLVALAVPIIAAAATVVALIEPGLQVFEDGVTVDSVLTGILLFT